MKKYFKRKSFSPPQEDKPGVPDITELIIKMQQQLSILDKKIDNLIGQSPAKPFNVQQPRPFQRFDHSHRQSERRQDNNQRERILHKAVCADCKKECEVPFRPSQDRPVYCKDCFSKRKVGTSFKVSADNRPREERPLQTSHIDKPQDGEKKKFPGRKRPAVKRRKARSQREA